MLEEEPEVGIFYVNQFCLCSESSVVAILLRKKATVFTVTTSSVPELALLTSQTSSNPFPLTHSAHWHLCYFSEISSSTGTLHWLFPLPGTFFPQLFQSLLPSPPSDLYSNDVSSMRPFLTTLFKHALFPPLPALTWFIFLFNKCHLITYTYVFYFIVPLIRSQHQEGKDFCLYCSLLCPQCLEKRMVSAQ